MNDAPTPDSAHPSIGGPRPGAGRHPSSPTGQRRRRVNWVIAPSAAALVREVAQQQGCSPSSLVETWALALVVTEGAASEAAPGDSEPSAG